MLQQPFECLVHLVSLESPVVSVDNLVDTTAVDPDASFVCQTGCTALRHTLLNVMSEAMYRQPYTSCYTSWWGGDEALRRTQK